MKIPFKLIVIIISLIILGGCGFMEKQIQNLGNAVGNESKETDDTKGYDDKYVPVQEYTGEGYDLPGGEKNDKFAKEHFSEIAEAVKTFFLKKYKTEVIVHNAVGNADGATVFVESVGEPHFHTFVVVPFDLRNKKVQSDSIFTIEGEVENAIIQGIVAMALEEEISNLNNYLEGLPEKYPVVGLTEEAINNVMATGYTTPYYFISATRSNFGYLFDMYMKNPNITKEEIKSVFDKESYKPKAIGFAIKLFMAEPDVEPNKEIFNQVKHDIETLEEFPRGMYSLVLNDNNIDKTNARGEKDNSIRMKYPNYIIRD